LLRQQGKRHHELNYSSGLAVVLEDILPSRRSKKHNSLLIEAATERDNGRTHGRNDRHRGA